MPLDDRIAGSVKVPEWTPQVRLEEDAAKLEALREARRQKIEDAKDQAAMNAAIKAHVGDDGIPDYQGAIKSLYLVSPRAASMLESRYTKLREDAAKQTKADLDNDTLTAKLLAQAAEVAIGPDGTVDPDRYALFRSHAARIDPETQKYLGDTPDPKVIQHFISAGTEVAEANKVHKEATDHFLNGDWQKALGMSLPLASTQEDVDQLFAQARANGMPKEIYDAYPKDLTPENQAKWAQLSMTEKERQDLADKQAGRTLQASQQAQTAKYQAGELAIQQQNANTAALREKREGQAAVVAASGGPEIKPGTPDFKVAQDLAYGRMTPSFFRTLQAYNRDAGKKAAIYAKAAELNPEFNEADFERGFKFISSPRIASQLAALDNSESGIPDLLKASAAAKRSRSPFLNTYAVQPIKTALGNKSYSNFKTAVTAFADELSGALGYGSATDMAREMGFNMTDMSQSPAVFESNIRDIVLPFVERKRASILKQGSAYGKSENNSSVTPTKPATEKPPTNPVKNETHWMSPDGDRVWNGSAWVPPTVKKGGD